ncbi:MAG: hypothetical protein AAGA10_14125 [Bacteroidota bacterium]
MNYSEYMKSLTFEKVPTELSVFLQAMWLEAKGKWEQAHSLVEHDSTQHGAWIHAYLHRVEGDKWNAGYWYRRAAKPFPSVSQKEEWAQIVTELLQYEQG